MRDHFPLAPRRASLSSSPLLSPSLHLALTPSSLLSNMMLLSICASARRYAALPVPPPPCQFRPALLTRSFGAARRSIMIMGVSGGAVSRRAHGFDARSGPFRGLGECALTVSGGAFHALRGRLGIALCTTLCTSACVQLSRTQRRNTGQPTLSSRCVRCLCVCVLSALVSRVHIFVPSMSSSPGLQLRVFSCYNRGRTLRSSVR